MTNKQAINGLKYLISDECTDSQYGFVEEIETAIKALEKQVEKKPKKIGKQHYACPLCDSILDISYDDIFIYEMQLPNYCETCGQALDWGDIE